MRSIAKIFNISVGFVHHVVDLHRKYGQVTDPYTQPWTGHRILTYADEDYIHTLIDERLSIYLDEIQDTLFFEHVVYVSLTTISQTLAQMQISKESLLQKAAERNERLWTLWKLEIAKVDDPNFFIFINESAVNNRTVQCSTGWSATGGCSASHCTFLCGKCHSILPALSLDSIIALNIFEGSVNKERFWQFLHEEVVSPFSSLPQHGSNQVQAPQLNLFPGEKSVVILDNCSIHHDEEI